MAESSAAEENIELANLPAEGGASEAAADADGEETNISAGEEKSDGEKATDEAKATDATEDNIERAEDIENGEATADTGDPVSPDPPKTVNVVEEAPKQSSPKKAKKSSRDNQKLRVFLLDGRTLDLERGVSCFFVYLLICCTWLTLEKASYFKKLKVYFGTTGLLLYTKISLVYSP